MTSVADDRNDPARDRGIESEIGNNNRNVCSAAVIGATFQNGFAFFVRFVSETIPLLPSSSRGRLEEEEKSH